MRRVVALVVLVGALLVVPAAGAKVLLVGTYHGVRGKYSSLQAAVDAAQPGDWILLAPGDYKTTSSRHPQRPRRTKPPACWSPSPTSGSSA